MTHVCRRWRNVIFGSPQRLDLRLLCTNATPVRTSLGIWPPLPITISCKRMLWDGSSNVIAAFEHSNRISDVEIFDIIGSALKNLLGMMRGPFPILRYFYLRSSHKSIPVVPETFLGGSKPRLETFMLSGIPFLSFPKFVFSAISIQFLSLCDIPNSGYISPETMAICLAALPNLIYLSIGFRSPRSRPIQIGPLPLIRSVLPALARLIFHGVSKYLEEFVARIDTPSLWQLHVVYFMDPIFHIPRLHDFIQRTEGLMPCNQACMEFTSPAINIILGSRAQFKMEIRCQRPDWQLSSMAQIFGQLLPLLSQVEQLEIREGFWLEYSRWRDDPDMSPSLWLELLHLFVAVWSLHVSEVLVPPIAVALQELGEGRTMEVLPALQILSLEGLQQAGCVQKVIQSFVTSRQLSGHPIVIETWERQLTR